MEQAYRALDHRRGFCLAAGVLGSLVAGILYTWSVLQAPFVARLGGDALKGIIVLGYTIQSVFSAIGAALFAGFIRRLGTRRIIMLGGLMIGLGYIACGFIESIPLFFLVFGFVAGTGNAFVYPQYLAYCTSLYPERRGTVSGIIAGTFGGAAIIWSPIMAGLVELAGLSTALLAFGGVALLILLPTALLIVPVPEGYAEYRTSLAASDSPGKRRAIGLDGPQLTRAEALRTSTFYLSLFALILGLTSGNICITQTSSIFQESFGLSATSAAVFVSLMSFMSMAGRLIWGSSADFVNRLRILAILTGIPILTMGILTLCHGEPVTIICMSLTAFCYGGFGGALMPLAAELFGARHASDNFAALFVCFGFAGLLGPQIAVRLSRGGDYTYVFLAAAVLSLLAFISANVTRASLGRLRRERS